MHSSLRRLLAAACVAVLVALGAGQASAAEPAFPRALGLYLQHSSLPSAQDLARYDVVVIDGEWGHRDPAKIAAARQINPDVKFLAYVNVVDRNTSLGSQDAWRLRWSLWGYTAPNSLGTFPEQWIAKRASGATVSEWPGTWMTNLSDTAPAVDGQRFYQYAANWVVDNVWASGVWDGIFLDVWGDRIWNSDASTWDIDRDGADESGAALYGAGSPWERGVNAAEQIMRSRMGPSAILVANNTRTFRNGQISGRLWESFADPGKGRNFAWDAMDYVNGVNDPGHSTPGFQLTLDKGFSSSGGATDERRARYFLTATLLSNGYWGGSVGDYTGFGWHEEFDGAGLGRGYLGGAVAAAPAWSQVGAAYSTSTGVGKYSNGLYRRDFANGIAIVNPSGATQTITLETTFRRLSGSSSVNTGGTVQTLSIPAQDGIILLRDGAPAPTPAPPPSPTVTVGISPTTASVAAGDTRRFIAAASTSGAITWTVNGVGGGNSTVGTVSASGLYTAPASVPSGGQVTVRATHSSSGAFAQAAVTVTAPAPAPAPAPETSTPIAEPAPAPAPAPAPKSRSPKGKSPRGKSPKSRTSEPVAPAEEAVTPLTASSAPPLSAVGMQITQRTARTAILLIARLEARYRGAPVSRAARPRPSSGRIRLTTRQLRINQRIVVAALRRVNALTAKLQGRRPPRVRTRPAGVVKLSAAQARINRRIAVATLRRAQRLEVLMEQRPATS